MVLETHALTLRDDKQVTFDDTGELFADKMSLGKHGPDVRFDKYNFLREVTPETLQSYSPDQVAFLLSQRENVRQPDPLPLILQEEEW